nr:hypothetical protein [Nocardia sp.]
MSFHEEERVAECADGGHHEARPENEPGLRPGRRDLAQETFALLDKAVVLVVSDIADMPSRLTIDVVDDAAGGGAIGSPEAVRLDRQRRGRRRGRPRTRVVRLFEERVDTAEGDDVAVAEGSGPHDRFAVDPGPVRGTEILDRHPAVDIGDGGMHRAEVLILETNVGTFVATEQLAPGTQ